MADYYPLIARAVAGLERNTAEARRALYERARSALVAQLRGVSPGLEESEITRERLALEESIRKVEAEAARNARLEPVRPTTPIPPVRREPVRRERPPPAAAPPPAVPTEPVAAQPEPSAAAATVPAVESPAAETVSSPPPSDSTAPSASPEAPPPAAPEIPKRPARRNEAPDGAPRPDARGRPAERPADRKSISDQGSRAFRDILTGATDLDAAARSKHPARGDRAATPPAAHDFDQLEARVEARVEPEPARPPPRERPPKLELESSPQFSSSRPTPERSRPRPQLAGDPEEVEPPRLRRSYRGLVKTVITLLLLVGLGGLGYWQRETIADLYQVIRGSPAPVTREAARDNAQTTRPKIADRIGGAAQDTGRGGALAPVAQRVVLYEEEQSDPQGRRFLGTVVWRTETVSPGPGLPPELAVKAEVEIPEYRLTMTWSIRRNMDKTLPASHTIEIMFNLPSDFPSGGIANVPGILMKQAEQTRGVPLAGLAVKVTTGFFLIGLSAVDADMQRNIQLLKERPWFDIPLVYNNNKRAILALEKGTPGERAFTDAFAAWKQ